MTHLLQSLIDFYSLNLDMETVEELFGEIPVRNEVLWTAMIDRYGKIGFFDKARELFDEISERNVIS